MESNGVIVIEKDKESSIGNDWLKSESEGMIRENNEDEDGDLVTPWDVTASSKKGVDYDKLIG